MPEVATDVARGLQNKPQVQIWDLECVQAPRGPLRLTFLNLNEPLSRCSHSRTSGCLPSGSDPERRVSRAGRESANAMAVSHVKLVSVTITTVSTQRASEVLLAHRLFQNPATHTASTNDLAHLLHRRKHRLIRKVQDSQAFWILLNRDT